MRRGAGSGCGTRSDSWGLALHLMHGMHGRPWDEGWIAQGGRSTHLLGAFVGASSFASLLPAGLAPPRVR